MERNDHTTISQLIAYDNPGNVSPEKVVHIDDVAGKSLTYGGLRQQAAQCAWGFKRRIGLKEGHKVMIIAPNSTDYVLLAHSVFWAGSIFVPLTAASTAREIAHAVSITEPEYIISDPGKVDAVESALQDFELPLPSKPKLLTIGGRRANLQLFPDDVIDKTAAEPLPPHDVGGKSTKDIPAMIIFSSGTTGKFKGVRLSHYNLISSLISMRISSRWYVDPGSRTVFFPPYCHIYGISAVVLGGMWVGSFTYCMQSFDLETYCQKIEQYKATSAHIVPPIAVMLANSDVAAKYDLTSIKVMMVAGAPTKQALQRRLKSRFGQDLSVVQGFGQSETTGAVTMQSPHDDEKNLGTVGKAIAGVEVRLVNPNTFRDVARGEEGEMWVKGPVTMMGYCKNDQATKETFVGDWLRTGDIIREDEGGNFWVTDRLKELIKYKGFQVAPSELESLLLTHPSVADAAVTSIYSDEQATELPIAYVTLVVTASPMSKGRKDRLLQEIREWVDGQVSGHKRLRGGVYEFGPLPKTGSGKILRRDLPCRRLQESGRGLKL